MRTSQSKASFSSFTSSADNRRISLKDLEDSCEDERSSTRIGFRRQDSDAARMYN